MGALVYESGTAWGAFIKSETQYNDAICGSPRFRRGFYKIVGFFTLIYGAKGPARPYRRRPARIARFLPDSHSTQAAMLSELAESIAAICRSHLRRRLFLQQVMGRTKSVSPYRSEPSR